MGHVYVDATLSWATSEPVRLLVDTGATYGIVPADLAARLGLPLSPVPRKVRLADGREAEWPFTTLWASVAGREAAVTSFVAPPGAEPVLGVEGLECLGLAVDPADGRLLPTRAHAVLAVGYRLPP
ncbi:MAG: retroviral-like aspartic protease family protein [Deltaproteobacteria bacterium]|nr:retroviral-like aspartic protease family protein [Deltaproteobacteria bacterium]